MSKKQFRKDIEAKIDNAIGHLAKDAGKKFKKLLKKASHLLADGLHKPTPKPAAVKKSAAPAKPAPAKSTSAKAAPKKKTIKKKAAKKAPAKK